MLVRCLQKKISTWLRGFKSFCPREGNHQHRRHWEERRTMGWSKSKSQQTPKEKGCMSNRLALKKRTLGRETSGFKYLTLFQCCGTVLTVSSLPHLNSRGRKISMTLDRERLQLGAWLLVGRCTQQMAVNCDRAQDEVTDFAILLIAGWSVQV